MNKSIGLIVKSLVLLLALFGMWGCGGSSSSDNDKSGPPVLGGSVDQVPSWDPSIYDANITNISRVSFLPTITADKTGWLYFAEQETVPSIHEESMLSLRGFYPEANIQREKSDNVLDLSQLARHTFINQWHMELVGDRVESIQANQLFFVNKVQGENALQLYASGLSNNTNETQAQPVSEPIQLIEFGAVNMPVYPNEPVAAMFNYADTEDYHFVLSAFSEPQLHRINKVGTHELEVEHGCDDELMGGIHNENYEPYAWLFQGSNKLCLIGIDGNALELTVAKEDESAFQEASSRNLRFIGPTLQSGAQLLVSSNNDEASFWVLRPNARGAEFALLRNNDGPLILNDTTGARQINNTLAINFKTVFHDDTLYLLLAIPLEANQNGSIWLTRQRVRVFALHDESWHQLIDYETRSAPTNIVRTGEWLVWEDSEELAGEGDLVGNVSSYISGVKLSEKELSAPTLKIEAQEGQASLLSLFAEGGTNGWVFYNRYRSYKESLIGEGGFEMEVESSADEAVAVHPSNPHKEIIIGDASWKGASTLGKGPAGMLVNNNLWRGNLGRGVVNKSFLLNEVFLHRANTDEIYVVSANEPERGMMRMGKLPFGTDAIQLLGVSVGPHRLLMGLESSVPKNILYLDSRREDSLRLVRESFGGTRHFKLIEGN